MVKVLLYFPGYNNTIGGSENRFLSFCSWFQDKCELTVAMRIVPDFDFLANQYGIRVDSKKIHNVVLKLGGWKSFVGRIFACEEELALKILAKDYDICISCHGPRDFGKPAYHFIHMIWSFDRDLAVRFGKVTSAGDSFLKVALRQIRARLRSIVPFLPKLPKSIICNDEETCIPNSEYVKSVLEEHYGVKIAPVFYPPTFFEPLQDMKKDNLSIAYVGRIHEEKRIHNIIESVEHVRTSTGKDLQLYVAGYIDDSDYCDKLRKCAVSRQWLHFVGEVRGVTKQKFLSDKSFAMHFLKGEAFGISITEYIKCGIVPIVPRGSAPNEIVSDDDLAFDSQSEACVILERLVLDRRFLDTKRRELLSRAEYFSKERYLAREDVLLDGILESCKKKGDAR